MPVQYKFITRPLFLQVRDELLSRITDGYWKPGALIPNEVHLASEFGVSQGTMRKALNLLESERIVSRQQGRGTVVVDQDLEEMSIRFSSIFNDLEQRISGHILSCEPKFDKATPDEAKLLGLKSGERVARARRVRAYHDRAFMIEDVTLIIRHFKNLALEELSLTRICSIAQNHRIILSHARETVTPILCPADYLATFGLSDPVPILVLERVTYRDGGDAVEHRKAWCHLRDKHYVSVTN